MLSPLLNQICREDALRVCDRQLLLPSGRRLALPSMSTPIPGAAVILRLDLGLPKATLLLTMSGLARLRAKTSPEPLVLQLTNVTDQDELHGLLLPGFDLITTRHDPDNLRRDLAVAASSRDVLMQSALATAGASAAGFLDEIITHDSRADGTWVRGGPRHRSTLYRQLLRLGLPPASEVERILRITEAVRELQLTVRATVEKAALRQGFASVTAFRDQLQRRVGQPPSAVRRWFGLRHVAFRALAYTATDPEHPAMVT